MFACFSVSPLSAVCVGLVKSGFAAITGGLVSGFISLCGGLVSIAGQIILMKFAKKTLSYTGIAVISALLHNFGQLAAASLTVGSLLYLYYAPVLIISAVAGGLVTGIILTAVMPSLKKLVKQ